MCVNQNPHAINMILWLGFLMLKYSIGSSWFNILFSCSNYQGVFDISKLHVGPPNVSSLSEKARCPTHYLRISEGEVGEWVCHSFLIYKINTAQQTTMNQQVRKRYWLKKRHTLRKLANSKTRKNGTLCINLTIVKLEIHFTSVQRAKETKGDLKKKNMEKQIWDRGYLNWEDKEGTVRGSKR